MRVLPLVSLPKLVRGVVAKLRRRNVSTMNRQSVAAVAYDEFYQTDMSPPPESPGDEKATGAYCIKASVELWLAADPVYSLVGYNDNLSIQEHVNDLCHRFARENPEQLSCVNEKLVFLGPKRRCHG